MSLLVDIGNSRIKILQDNGKSDDISAFKLSPENLESQLMKLSDKLAIPDRIIVSNVAGDEVAEIFNGFCQRVWDKTPEYISVRRELHGMTLGYRECSQFGVDRWLAIMAAWNRYKGSLCVVDCGSAVTVDIISIDGQHTGGYIIPGRYLMQKVLANNTSQLVFSENDSLSIAAGRSTQECIHNGTTLAVVGFIENIVRSVNSVTGYDHHCIITGGGASEIISLLNIDYIHEPALVIDGLRLAGDS